MAQLILFSTFCWCFLSEMPSMTSPTKVLELVLSLNLKQFGFFVSRTLPCFSIWLLCVLIRWMLAAFGSCRCAGAWAIDLLKYFSQIVSCLANKINGSCLGSRVPFVLLSMFLKKVTFRIFRHARSSHDAPCFPVSVHESRNLFRDASGNIWSCLHSITFAPEFRLLIAMDHSTAAQLNFQLIFFQLGYVLNW